MTAHSNGAATIDNMGPQFGNQEENYESKLKYVSCVFHLCYKQYLERVRYKLLYVITWVLTEAI